jgi:MerR family transcriptional regulator, light-induced transcriptional regulator
MEALIKDAQENCPSVPASASETYGFHINRMTEDVDNQFMDSPDLRRLIGDNPVRMMQDNHRNHAAFMLTVFSLNNMELLCRTIPWVYRAYMGRGCHADYFPAVLKAWQGAIGRCLEPPSAGPILSIYGWLSAHHLDWLALSQSPSAVPPEGEGKDADVETWVQRLLKGDARTCLKLAEEQVEASGDIARLYLDAIQPAMYRIGKLWESGAISPVQEHMATAVVTRIMATLYERMNWPLSGVGRAVIACAPNEFHEVGARMVADLLEMDGWDVTFMGANTPEEDLIAFLVSEPPDLLGISVSMVFNLAKIQELVAHIRERPELKTLRILVGGPGIGGMASVGQSIGADGWAKDAREAVAVARQWLESGGGNP